MSAAIQIVAAEIASRLRALNEDSPLNAASVIAGLINPVVESEVLVATDRLHNMLWNIGWCSKCNSEIQHDIMEPFASCNCGTGESTVIPLIPDLRHELAVKARMLSEAQDCIAKLEEELSKFSKTPETQVTRPAEVRVTRPHPPLTLPDPKPFDRNTPH